PLAVGALAALLLAVWAVSFEYYPFTGVQMYSDRRTSTVIAYLKVLGHYESGAVAPIRLDYAIPGLKDTRYRRAIDLCFDPNPAGQRTAERFLLLCADRLNRRARPGDRLAAIEVQRWKWDYGKNADDPNFGQITSRFIATPGQKA